MACNLDSKKGGREGHMGVHNKGSSHKHKKTQKSGYTDIRGRGLMRYFCFLKE